MAFPHQFLDEVKLRTSLPEVVGRRVQLRKKGREWEGLCPFHKEKTPSFTVNEEKGFYHCFGCGEHGSVFDFVMKTDGLSFPETVERLATDAGMQVPQDTPEERQRSAQRKSLEDATEAACKWFERTLQMPEGKAALDYLRDRGLDDDTIRIFRVGFAPNSRNALKGALLRDDIPEDLMVDAGLLIRPPDDRPDDHRDNSAYDRFRGRVIFPIMNRQGHVIAFGGRILGDGEPKYLNSPETPIFHKGQVLYGLGQALGPARKSGHMIVTEGYMDVIAMHMAGFHEAVAPLGTALTEDHLRALWKIVREPVLCFDGDAAGQRAAARAAERALPLLKSGYGLRFAELPKGEDPDTLVRGKGRDAMQGILDNALPLSEVLWRMETGGRVPGTPEARATLQSKLGEYARRIDDPTVRTHFAASFKERIWQGRGGGYGGKGSRGSWKPGARGRKNPATMALSGAGSHVAQSDPARRRLEILLATLINHPILYDDVAEHLGALDFTSAGETLDNLRQEVLKTLAVESGLDNQGLLDHLNENGFASALSALMGSDVLGDAFFARSGAEPRDALDGWEEAFGRMRGKDLESEIAEAQRQLAEDPTEENWHRLQFLQKQKFDTSDAYSADG
ncbi:MAG: DNA primase [Alphaproteobacteria bacterium]|nr:DNA primase [Alphaproteobacteria bacterium]